MEKKSEISKTKAFLIVLAALLDDIAAIVLVIVVLRLLNVEVPLWGLIFTGLVLGTFIFIVHRAVIPSLRRRKVTGAEGMLGLTGEVTKALKPKGIIRVKSEYWRAKSLEGEINIGEDVEIVGIKGLDVEVKRKADE